MTETPVVIDSNRRLFENYERLGSGDMVCGRVRLKPGEEHLLVDLLQRGIILIPSATAQLASRSKAFQVRLLEEFMLPGTRVIYSTADLLATTTSHRRYAGIIVKLDRKNAGMGIHFFRGIEDVYNMAHGGAFPLPFVIQPFKADYRDIRVIILGEYVEAYQRTNPANFRKNLHCGGSFTRWVLSGKQLQICRRIMARAAFPYAHLDLMVCGEKHCWLQEINLRGGLRGAAIEGREYRERVAQIHADLVAKERTRVAVTKLVGEKQ